MSQEKEEDKTKKDADLPTSIVDALYTQLLLRDLFGKIVPGAILLLACAPLLGNTASLNEILKSLQEITIWGWLLLYGFAWVTGFAIQSFAERPLVVKVNNLFLIKYVPASVTNIKDFYKDLDKFRNYGTRHQRQQFERLTVIKEACGNSYVAVSMVTVLWFVHWLPSLFSDPWSNKTKFIALGILFSVYLNRMHFIHVDRQYTYMKQALDDINPHASQKKSEHPR